MKFKEKDPIVSMEQWFPNDINCKVEGVRQARALRETEITTFVSFMDDGNNHINDELRNSPGLAEKTKQSGYVAIGLLVNTVKGKKCFVSKKGIGFYDHKVEDVLVVLNSSDWVLTYQSGRREVLTDKEKQERFE